MTKNNFGARKEKILELVIEDYINTASPISSRAISRRLRKTLSPATIRNIMADLEDAGLITHPHTSAGRIPTDKGYRYYLDTLMQASLLTDEEKRRVDKTFRQKFEQIDELMVVTSRLLSSISEEVGLVTFPSLEKGVFKHIELVEIDKNKILIVLVTRSGLIKNIIVEFDEMFKKNDLNKIANFLNNRFNGIPLYEIKKSLTQQLLIEKDSLFYILDEAKKIIDLMLNSIRGRIYLEGTSNVIGQPEFRKNLDKIESLLEVLENPVLLSSIAKRNLDKAGVAIYIGEETEIEGLCDCSMVVTNYAMKNDCVGVLGIVGPKRMQYAKIVSLVDYISKILSEVIG